MDHPNESNEENEMFDIRFDDERSWCVCTRNAPYALHTMHKTHHQSQNEMLLFRNVPL